MRGELAREVFAETRTSGFSFDVEVLGRFQRRGATIVEFPVTWVDVPGLDLHPGPPRGVQLRRSSPTIAWRLRRREAESRGPVPSDRRPAAGPAARLTCCPSFRWRRRAEDAPRTTGRRRQLARPLALAGRWLPSATPGSSRVALVEAGARRRLRHAHATRDSRLTSAVDGVSGGPTRRSSSRSTPGCGGGCCCTVCRLDAVLDADCGIPVFSPLVLSRRRTVILLLVHHVHHDQFRTYFPPALARWAGSSRGG